MSNAAQVNEKALGARQYMDSRNFTKEVVRFISHFKS
jgi:hypothetical protein